MIRSNLLDQIAFWVEQAKGRMIRHSVLQFSLSKTLHVYRKEEKKSPKWDRTHKRSLLQTNLHLFNNKFQTTQNFGWSIANLFKGDRLHNKKSNTTRSFNSQINQKSTLHTNNNCQHFSKLSLYVKSNSFELYNAF